jgi:uncharacterized membrane protein YkgB
MKEITVRPANRAGGHALEFLGGLVIRYGLVIVLIWLGAMKFTKYESANIEPMVKNSPAVAWAYNAIGLGAMAGVIGGIEVLIGLMIAVRPVNARVSATGSLLAAVLFIVTLSFLFTTPGAWEPSYGAPFPSIAPGQVLLKDVVLLGAAIWTAGEALAHARARVVVERHETVQNAVVVEP